MGRQSALQSILAMQAKHLAGLAETQRLTALRAMAALALIGSAGNGRRLWPCVLRYKANRLNGGFGRMHWGATSRRACGYVHAGHARVWNAGAPAGAQAMRVAGYPVLVFFIEISAFSEKYLLTLPL